MITTVKLINTSITSHSYHCVCVCVCEIRTHKIYSPSNSQVYNTVLLTIVTMLCIVSPELIYLIIKFVPFDQHLPISPSVSSWNHHFTLCFYEYNPFIFHM